MTKRPAQLLILLLCALLLLQGTLAWQNIQQTATNEMYYESTSSPVQLLKLEKLPDGRETLNPIAGAEFILLDELGEQIGTTYVTDKDGLIKLEKKLPIGKYAFVEVQSIPGYTFDVDENGEPITRYEFEVVGDKIGIEIRAFNRRLVGALILNKQVANEDDSILTPEQAAQEFEFTVTFSEVPQGDTYYYKLNDGDPQPFVTDEDNTGKLKLKHGDTAVFENIPYGVRYVITETPVEGYVISSTGSYGHITEDGAKAQFVNTAVKTEEEPENGAITVKKTVDPAVENDELVFKFEAKVGESTYQFVLGHGDIYKIEDIAPGTEYTVTELINDPGYPAGYHATVTVYTGSIAGGENLLLEFVNRLDEAPDGKTGSLEISKTINAEEDDIDTELAFAFELKFSKYPESGYCKYTLDGETYVDFIPDAETGKGIIYLAHGEKVRFENIPHGVTYTITEVDAGEYVPAVGTITGTVVGDITVSADFVNVPKEVPPDPIEKNPCDIYIEKILKGKYSDEDLTDEQKQKAFNFTVAFEPALAAEQGKFTYYIGDEGPFVSQDGRLALKPGQVARIVDIPYGTTYSIMEDDYSIEDYIQLVEHCYGITSGTDIYAKVTNIYTGEITIDIPVEKTWDLDNLPEGAVAPMPAFIELQLKRGETNVGDIVAVRPDADGKWKHTFIGVPKYDSEGNEIVYTVYEVPVTSFVAVKGRGDYGIKNIYVPPVTNADAPIKVIKKIEGEEAPEKTFVFTLAGDGTAPMPDGIVAAELTESITGAGEVRFGTITFTNPGTYAYTLTEVIGTSAGWTYDSTVYTITYVVTFDEDDGELDVECTITKPGEEPDERDEVDEAVFTNLFDKDIAALYTNISGKKTWDHGDNHVSNQPKEITVYLSANGEIKQERIVTAETNWEYVFEDLLINDENGSPIQYTVSEKSMPEYVPTVTGYDIHNTYVPNVAVRLPKAVKYIEGKNVPLTEFRFVLASVNNAPMPEGSTGGVKIIKVSGDGEFELGTIYFDKAGIYEYTIYEMDDGAENWKYDDARYRLTITVTGSGSDLTAATKLVKNDNTVSVRKASFKNRYNEDGWDGSTFIRVRKFWEHGKNPTLLRPSSIVVVLYGDGKVVTRAKVTAEDGWEYTFVVPKYRADGSEIKYTVDEEKVDNYTKHISRFDILNTYVSSGGGSDKPKDPELPSFSPQTGDDSNLPLWISIFVLCSGGMVALLAATRRGSGKKRRKHKHK